MRFVPLQDLPDGAPEVICKAGGRRALTLALASLLVASATLTFAVSAASANRPLRGACYAVGLIALPFALVGYASYRRTLDPTNWVCQIRGDRLFLRCARRWGD